MTWRDRALAVVFVVGATAVGHLITSNVEVNRADDPPFVETGEVGDVIRLTYADVEVDDVRPAQYLGSPISTELAAKAGGVWVVVAATVTATHEPVQVQSAWLEGSDGLRYRASSKSRCAVGLKTWTGVPLHALWCFDVPADELSGLRFLLARGELFDPGDEEIDGDAVAEVDLGISAGDAREWAETTDAYLARSYEFEPFDLSEITLNEVES